MTGNLIWTEDHLGHNIEPAARPPARDVTTIVSTRYWVDSVHEHVEHPEPDYFTRRAQLFLDHTLPSMRAQATPPDRWLVLFSPWVIRQHPVQPVLDALATLPFAELVLVPEQRAFSSVTKEWITHHMRRRRGRWLASVRLDNDDMLAHDYIDALAKWVTLAHPVTPSTVVFPIGIQADRHETRLDVSPVNHCTAAISRPDTDGVYDPYLVQHTEIYRTHNPQTETVYQLPTRFPMWVEVLHPDNAANHHRPGPSLAGGWSTRFHLADHLEGCL